MKRSPIYITWDGKVVDEPDTIPPVHGPTNTILIACPRRAPLTPPEQPRGLLGWIVAIFRNLRQHGDFRHPDSRYWD